MGTTRFPLTDFYEIWYLNIFRKTVEKIQVSFKYDKNNDADYLLHSTPDDGQKTCPKHVEFYSKNKFQKLVHLVFIIRSHQYIQCVPLATEPGISLIILTPMKILQRNLNSTCYVVVTFLTQWGKSASNFFAISSLVVKLLKKCRVR